MNPMVVPAILAGLAAVLWLLAGAMGAVGWHFREVAEAARAWPTTQAVVVRSATYDTEYRDAKGYTQTRTSLDFAYTYEVGGRAYEGLSYDVSGAVDSAALPQIVADHPVGSRVLVHYDPVDPKTAGVSIQGGSTPTIFLLAAALLTGIGGVFGFFAVTALLRKTRRLG